MFCTRMTKFVTTTTTRLITVIATTRMALSRVFPHSPTQGTIPTRRTLLTLLSTLPHPRLCFVPSVSHSLQLSGRQPAEQNDTTGRMHGLSDASLSSAEPTRESRYLLMGTQRDAFARFLPYCSCAVTGQDPFLLLFARFSRMSDLGIPLLGTYRSTPLDCQLSVVAAKR